MAEKALTCYKHPEAETSLRCNKCERPICARCAIQTPVGYRCIDCVRGQQAVFDTALGYDHVIAAVAGALGVGVAIFLLGYLGVWGLLLAPVMGAMLAGGIRIMVRRRRSSNLPRAAALGGSLGIVVNVGLGLAEVSQRPSRPFFPALAVNQAFTILWPLAHGILVIVVLYLRLREIRT